MIEAKFDEDFQKPKWYSYGCSQYHPARSNFVFPQNLIQEIFVIQNPMSEAKTKDFRYYNNIVIFTIFGQDAVVCRFHQ